MDKLFFYFLKIRKQNPEIDEDVRAILSEDTNPERGMTMSEIKAAYKTRVEQPFPVNAGSITMSQFLLSIPYVAGYSNENGTLFFFSLR